MVYNFQRHQLDKVSPEEIHRTTFQALGKMTISDDNGRDCFVNKKEIRKPHHLGNSNSESDLNVSFFAFKKNHIGLFQKNPLR